MDRSIEAPDAFVQANIVGTFELLEACRSYKKEICNKIKFLSSGDYDVLINCAAYTDVEKAEKDQTLCLDINACALKHLSEQCRKNGILFVHFSTNYIFDGTSQNPYK